VVVLSVLMAVGLIRSQGRLEEILKDLRARESTDTSPMLAEMKKYAPDTRWIYVQQGREAYAFHANLPMPPEIGVVSLKRFWSGQISNEKIVATCAQYHPEQLFFNPSVASNLFGDYLDNYIVAEVNTNATLYLAKEVVKPTIR